MPIFLLDNTIKFPNPELANEEGLLAVGGDLSPERILLAYRNGIFPWFNNDDEILWWSPDPRLILKLEDLKVSKSLKRIIKSNKFQVKFDKQFSAVINACANTKREGEFGTWITEGMKNAYIDLHKKGIAHSVEVYLNNKLVGGLYGLIIGKIFCGESMFHTISNASKIALYFLVEKLKKEHFLFIDAQTPTEHLISMGAIEVSRTTFLNLLKQGQHK